MAAAASVLTALMLIAAKTVAWLLTGSVSLLASLVDSVMDSLASLINFFAIRYSLVPADDEHRFGHGKAEALAGLGQAVFIAASSLFLIHQSVLKLLEPSPIEQSGVGIAVMVFSIVLTFGLLLIQKYVVRETGSTAIEADSLHYLSDLGGQCGDHCGAGPESAWLVVAGRIGWACNRDFHPVQRMAYRLGCLPVIAGSGNAR